MQGTENITATITNASLTLTLSAEGWDGKDVDGHDVTTAVNLPQTSAGQTVWTVSWDRLPKGYTYVVTESNVLINGTEPLTAADTAVTVPEGQENPVWLTSADAAAGKTWYDLPQYDDTGAEIVYTVEETGMKYGETEISNWENVFTVTTPSAITNGVITIDNAPNETAIQVTKDWTNNGTGRTDQTSIVFEVHQVCGNTDTALATVWTSVGGADATQTSTPTVLYDNGWQTVTVSKLPLYVWDGTAYAEATYYVVETGVTGTTVITYQKESGTEGEAAAQATNNGETITIYNRDASVDIKVVKIDANNSSPLPNAKFKLYRLTGSDFAAYPSDPGNEQTTGSNGDTTFQQLPEGCYKIEESAPPAGYNSITAGIFFTVSADGAVTWTDANGVPISAQSNVEYTSATKTFTVGNMPGVELPATGGPGTALYTAGGLTMMLLAALWLLLRRRKQQGA